EVILNGDSPVPTRVIEGVLQPVALVTAEQRLAQKNELKARGTLLMALPDKHQLKFNSHKDAKTLMEAIEKRFGGNTETKKVQKTLLKQHFKNFTGFSSEGLDQIHDRLQKLVSQLEIHGVYFSQEDVNLKFFQSLPSEWKTHTLFWRNKANLEEQSLDDLFNSIKIDETKVKQSSSTSTASQNLAFISSSHTDSTTDPVSVDAIIYSFFASQSTSPQLDNKDLKQIDVNDLEEMDLRWQMTGKNIGANGPTSMGFDMTKVECYNCHRTGHFARECRSSKDPRRSEEEPANFSLMAFSSSSSDKEETCLESVEARLLVYKQNESVIKENIKLLNIKVQLRDTALATLRQKLDKAEKDRDDLKLKLEKFQTSSKNLTELLASQTSEKTRLGYNSQVFTKAMFDCDTYYSSKSECKSWPPSSLYDRFQPSGGYHAIPSLYTGTFMPPKPDMVFNTTLTAIETDHLAFNVQLSATKPAQDLHTVQPLETTISVATPALASPQSNSSGKRRNRKACFYALLTHLKPQKYMVPHAVLTQSKPISNTSVRPVSATLPNITVTRPRHAHHDVTKSTSPIRGHIPRSPYPKTSNSPPRVTTAQAPVVSATQGNMSYLSKFKELNGGYVAFRGNPKGGKITGKGKIKTSKLDFDDVYFVKELKFNLFSVSQMCDKKNSVLFTDIEYLVLSPDFKLIDES
nr:hypothetical protein [Tanacetum cinerariifolium]